MQIKGDLMNKILMITLLIVLLAGSSVSKQKVSNPVSPYPGSSPFPPGGEPALTHTVTVFWTTEDGMKTDIEIIAPNERATQFFCWKWVDGKNECIANSIAPSCNYHILMSSEKSNHTDDVLNIPVKGFGTIEIRVHGFKESDFSEPPTVTAIYSKNDAEVSKTAVLTHPISKNFKGANK
jgi:hypothetical protein